jgi:hypothetical protein
VVDTFDVMIGGHILKDIERLAIMGEIIGDAFHALGCPTMQALAGIGFRQIVLSTYGTILFFGGKKRRGNESQTREGGKEGMTAMNRLSLGEDARIEMRVVIRK